MDGDVVVRHFCLLFPPQWQMSACVVEEWTRRRKVQGRAYCKLAETVAGSLVVTGTRIDLVERGAGPPLLFLHAENGIEPAAAAIGALASSAHVIAPTHPGFGRSELPSGMRTVDDLSYFYLDLLDQLDLRDAIVVGVSFGAWIAAEVAVKSTARMSRLVMANAVGVKSRRSRNARHRRYLRAHRQGISRPRLRRSAGGTARLQGLAGCRSAGRCARPRSHGALCLESLLPQSAAQKPAAPHQHSDAYSCGAIAIACSAKPTAAPIAR